jgi:hypothetical protein
MTNRFIEDNCGYVAPVLPPSENEFKVLAGIMLKQLKITIFGLVLALLQCLVSHNTPVIGL